MKLLKSKKDDKKTDLERVVERREEVLAQGRKFKYPLQYTKHRVVVNTVLISFVVLGILVIGGWLALYKFKMTDEILYHMTEILPVPVAQVEGKNVRFSDYLMLYRSSITSFELQAGNSEGNDIDEVRRQYMRMALTSAEQYGYAMKLAKENDIAVSDEEVTEEFERHRQIGGADRSEEGFLKILKDNFGVSKKEYRRMLYLSLTKAKVAAKIDTEAEATSAEVERVLIEKGNSFRDTAAALGEKVVFEETGGLVDAKNIDGGRATEALKLEPGGVSEKFLSMNGDGYYYVKLIEKTEGEVNFASIFVPFKAFDSKYAELANGEQIKEYIDLQ